MLTYLRKTKNRGFGVQYIDEGCSPKGFVMNIPINVPVHLFRPFLGFLYDVNAPSEDKCVCGAALYASWFPRRDSIVAHVAFVDFFCSRIELRNAKRTRTDAKLASDASIDVDSHGAFFMFDDSVNRTSFGARRYFAVHTSPVEEAPLCISSGMVMVELESDVGICVEGEFGWVGPFAAEGCCFTGAIVPPLACYLTPSATDTFRRIN